MAHTQRKQRSTRRQARLEAASDLRGKVLILARMLETSARSTLTPDVLDTLEELRSPTCAVEREAAFLVAAILDPAVGMDQAAMPAVLRAAVYELLGLLRAAGAMEQYEISGGRYAIWGEPSNEPEDVNH